MKRKYVRIPRHLVQLPQVEAVDPLGQRSSKLLTVTRVCKHQL